MNGGGDVGEGDEGGVWWRWCYSGGNGEAAAMGAGGIEAREGECGGGVTVGRQRRCGWSREVMERVRESGYGDRIDRKMGSSFGVGRKSPPENFSGGGAVVAGGGGARRRR
ncbi:hypothetical protein Tco_0078576 [Tanacetum coccineum]